MEIDAARAASSRRKRAIGDIAWPADVEGLSSVCSTGRRWCAADPRADRGGDRQWGYAPDPQARGLAVPSLSFLIGMIDNPTRSMSWTCSAGPAGRIRGSVRPGDPPYSSPPADITFVEHEAVRRRAAASNSQAGRWPATTRSYGILRLGRVGRADLLIVGHDYVNRRGHRPI